MLRTNTYTKNVMKVSLLLLGALMGMASSEEAVNKTTTPQVPTKDKSSSDERETLARHITDFGLKLVNAIIEENGEKNVVVSPTSVAGVLAMTMLGSVGSSYEEIAKLIGFSPDILVNQHKHRDLGSLLSTLNVTDVAGAGTVYASGLFVSADAHIRSVFGDYVQRVYRAHVLAERFDLPDQAKADINKWVLEHTNGKLSEFLKEPLPADTRLVLLSALRFAAQWAQPFTPFYTTKMPFHGPNRELLADQMLNFGFFNYIFARELNCHMVVLPYNDTATSLYAIMPRNPKKTTLKQLLKELDAEKIDQLIESAENKTTVIRFPKMKLAANSNLRKPLHSMGIKSIFSPETANFALMLETAANKTEDALLVRLQNEVVEDEEYVKDIVNTLPNPGIHVDSVIHQVALTVDEYGTEAVAATAGVLARSSERFIADSPFYFFIRNERTKLVTFSAAIFDPTT